MVRVTTPPEIAQSPPVTPMTTASPEELVALGAQVVPSFRVTPEGFVEAMVITAWAWATVTSSEVEVPR